MAIRRTLQCCSVMLLAGLAAPALAKETYLDCSATTAGEGSKASPFNSLGEVNSIIFHAGDSLNVKAGTTCKGTLSPKGSGTKLNPIVLTSYGSGPLPIIDAGGAQEAVSLFNQDYWDISRLALRNPASTIGLRRGIAATADDNTIHRGLYIHDISVYDVAGQTNKATHSNDFIGSAGILVNGTTGTSRYDDVQVYNNSVVDCGGGGIKVRVGQMNNRGKNTHIWGNHVSYVGGDGVVLSYGEAPLIEDNVAGWLGYGKYPYTGGNFAGIWVLGCYDAVMRFNVVHNSLMSAIDSEAFDCDWGNEGTCTVEYNYSHDNAGGIFLNCDGCGTQPMYPKQVVRYNVFQNDCRMFSNGAGAQLEFYNNVVYCPNKAFEIAVPDHTNMTNNIWVGTANSTLPTGPAIEWQSNLFQTVHIPVNTAGSEGDPLFVDPGTAKDTLASAAGYKLRAGSPAIKHGEAILNNGGRDFWGNKVFPGGHPNIGAYSGRGL